MPAKEPHDPKHPKFTFQQKMLGQCQFYSALDSQVYCYFRIVILPFEKPTQPMKTSDIEGRSPLEGNSCPRQTRTRASSGAGKSPEPDETKQMYGACRASQDRVQVLEGFRQLLVSEEIRLGVKVPAGGLLSRQEGAGLQ